MTLQKVDLQDLEQAIADNHKALFCTGTRINGGKVCEFEELTYTFLNSAFDASIAFPVLRTASSGKLLDGMIEFYRSQNAQNVGCWSLNSPQTTDLNIKLLARGFQPGWKPCWMAVELKTIDISYDIPAGLIIKADNHTSVSTIKDLPYNEDQGYISPKLLQLHPEIAQRFIAFYNGEIVGHCCVFYTIGVGGVAGIYNVGVIPKMRNKGFGKSLVSAACMQARQKGYEYATLNANNMGRSVYEKVGFRFINYGLTWWLIGQNYISNAPSRETVEFAEAIGRGDISTLDSFNNLNRSLNLNKPLTNGMRLIQLATACNQSASAQWLINHGATCTALDAWDLNWKEKTKEILFNNIEEIDRRYYNWNGTLMHVAAERGDIELAELALSAGADLTICDTEYQGNAMAWAMHFRRDGIIKLIKDKTGSM